MGRFIIGAFFCLLSYLFGWENIRDTLNQADHAVKTSKGIWHQ